MAWIRTEEIKEWLTDTFDGGKFSTDINFTGTKRWHRVRGTDFHLPDYSIEDLHNLGKYENIAGVYLTVEDGKYEASVLEFWDEYGWRKEAGEELEWVKQ